MYIPLIKNKQKCAGQLSYGFNISYKLEGCTHEKKIPYGDLYFWNFVYKRFGINRRVRLSNYACFTCKTSAGFIKEVLYKMQHVQDLRGFDKRNKLNRLQFYKGNLFKKISPSILQGKSFMKSRLLD